MAGDEDKKKKKKKSKTAEEAPPPPPPAPEPEPEPVASMADDNDDWFASAGDDDVQAPANEQQAAAPPADDDGFNFDDMGDGGGEGDFLAEGGDAEGGELPPQPKKKPKYFVHWDRRKAKFYDYNYDYGTNYYASMVGYVDSKNAAFGYPGNPEVPRRMAFAERGINSALERRRNPDTRTQNLLNDIRSNIRSFENSQRLYAYGKQRV